MTIDGEQMRRRLAEARVGHLATTDGEGRPHLVPVCFVLDGEAVCWAVDQKPKASRDLKRLRNLAATAWTALLVDHYEEDWDALWWVRVDCESTQLGPGPEAERALDLLARKYEQYRARRPEGPVVRMEIRHWSSWSGAGLDP